MAKSILQKLLFLFLYPNSKYRSIRVIYEVATNTAVEEVSDTFASVREHTDKVYFIIFHVVENTCFYTNIVVQREFRNADARAQLL